MLFKRAAILLSVLLAVTIKSHGQNMIANNGFEAFNSLPSGPGEWWKTSGWNNVNNQAVFAWPYASPDYLSTNGSGQAHLPNSVYGNVNPFSGNAIMGFVAYYNQGAIDFREYISRPLNVPMTVGQQYTFSFMMTNGISGQYCGSGCNHIGVCFSLSPLTQMQHEPINVTPQWEINAVWWNTSWQLITFNYTATAPYRYFTIGNFYDDANTLHTVFNASSAASYGAYYFIDEMIVQPSTPLPVSLLYFSGENRNNNNHLTWSTATEVNNDYFDIEKSQDGIAFVKTGIVEGNGNSTETINYEFTDAIPYTGTTYYRLRQVDYNGEFSYSEVIAVKTQDGENNCYLYSAERGIYSLSCTEPVSGSATVLSGDGKIIMSFNISERKEIKIDLTGFSNGIYFLKIPALPGIKYYKLIKN